MKANITINSVSMTPKPATPGNAVKVEVSIDYELLTNLAYVGSYVGSYVNSADSERPDKLPLAFVGDLTEQ